MLINLCHACGRVNADAVAHCVACGVFLDQVDTEWLTLDKPAPAGPAWQDNEASITLRNVEPMRPAGAIWTTQIPLPVVEELVMSDDEPLPAVIAPMDDLPAPPPVSNAVRNRHKAERRAAVRRLHRRGARAQDAEPAVAEVLVCDADDGARDRLSSLLRDFGFGVLAVDQAEKALALAASRHFVAAFVDVALDASDGGAGIDLCKQLRAHGRRHGGTDTLLVLASAALQPMDRVRAALAGCDETIAKPLTRGSVAGALDKRGIALPVDPRSD